MIILIIKSPIFHKLLKKFGCGWVERPSVCGHLDVKEMSDSNALGALTTIELTLNYIYPEIISGSMGHDNIFFAFFVVVF